MNAHSSIDSSHEQVSEVIAAMVMQKGFRDGAAFINNECVNGKTEYLNCVLDVILNPEKNIENLDYIEWCKWLIAGGRSPDDFASKGKVNDTSVLQSTHHDYNTYSFYVQCDQ